MSQLEAQRLALVPGEPWKNGGGVTRPLAERNGEWRVSLANVDADGPYSRFEGMTRLSLVIGGDGVVLRGPEREFTLARHVPTIYDGSTEWAASLIDGPVVAFNIMARKYRYLPSAEILSTHMALPPGAAAVILSGHSRCALRLGRSETMVEIPPEHFLVIESVDEPMVVERDAELPAEGTPPVVALIEPTEDNVT